MGGWCLLYEVFSNGMGGSCGAVDHTVGRDASSCVTYVVFVGGGVGGLLGIIGHTVGRKVLL